MFLQETALASPWLSPAGVGVILSVGVVVIGFVVWLIRVEGRINNVEKTTTRIDQQVDDGWKDFDQHRSNDAIHFNQRLANEVERRQSDRMGRLEEDIKEIKVIVKAIASK